jgi:hypothetical protein
MRAFAFTDTCVQTRMSSSRHVQTHLRIDAVWFRSQRQRDNCSNKLETTIQQSACCARWWEHHGAIVRVTSYNCVRIGMRSEPHTARPLVGIASDWTCHKRPCAAEAACLKKSWLIACHSQEVSTHITFQVYNRSE